MKFSAHAILCAMLSSIPKTCFSAAHTLIYKINDFTDVALRGFSERRDDFLFARDSDTIAGREANYMPFGFADSICHHCGARARRCDDLARREFNAWASAIISSARWSSSAPPAAMSPLLGPRISSARSAGHLSHNRVLRAGSVR